MWNQAFFSLPSEAKFSLQFQISLPKRKWGRTLGGSVVEVSRIRSILVTKQNNFIKRNTASIRRILPIRQDITYSFCFTGAETEIHKIKDDSKIDREKNIDRRRPRQTGSDWHIPDPPTFWLPTTFKDIVQPKKRGV
jgi:hypothetical protein